MTYMKQVYLDTLRKLLKVLENTEDETDSYFDIKYSKPYLWIRGLVCVPINLFDKLSLV